MLRREGRGEKREKGGGGAGGKMEGEEGMRRNWKGRRRKGRREQ